ncbi:adenosylcobinamide-GDP ribazoletransferase [Desulfolithobacter dissulfuricans]|uniref:adenosylcobinamide-GDP ribazoletransferase n=1 Tax=Desulfolithobacter dissulfuricans TaxID=2795293 RepID=UPI002278E925|nr:adenosylcobinamide-GDP ribazoletransferase [Desulfolithobacter dissulfuricans]
MAAAFRFLTILPLPGRLGTTEEELAGSVGSFPLIGLLLGLICAAGAWVLWLVLPSLPAAVCLTLLLLALSGGLHLDGLADTADGFFSARPDRTQILAIMRDSRIGAMGVIALIILLLLKTSALATLDRSTVVVTALLLPLAGRSAIVLMMGLLPYARPEGGLGGLFYTRRSRLAALGSLAFAGLVTVWLAGTCGLGVLVFTMGTICLFARFCRKKIGGATGDTLGAACELAETFMALGFAAVAGGAG